MSTWAQRIQDAKRNRIEAMAAEERTIIEAAEHGTTPSDIARALGTRNRQRVYAILKKDPAGHVPTQAPASTPVVYLRGAGRTQKTWAQVETAMWARGWRTTHDRTTAWHLARGGVPVVLCDFSTDLDHPEPAPGGGTYFGYHRYFVVGRVRAKYEETTRTGTGTVADLLTTADAVRHHGQSWLQEPVQIACTEMALPLVNGGESAEKLRRDAEARNKAGDVGAYVVDENHLALLVAQALED